MLRSLPACSRFLAPCLVVVGLACTQGGESEHERSLHGDAVDEAPSEEKAPEKAEPEPVEGEGDAGAKDAGEPVEAPTQAPSEDVWDSGVAFSPGPITFEPTRAGDGELPASPTKHLDPEVGTFFDHPGVFGWTKDGSSFSYCATGCADHCGDCFEINLDGTVKESPEQTCEAVEALKATLSVPEQVWPYGADLRVVWRARGRTLELGIEAVDGGAPVWAPAIELAEDFDLDGGGTIYPELAVLSPNARTLAVLAHGWMGDCSDGFELTLVELGPLAAEAYAKAAFGHHKKGARDRAAAERAAELFGKAAQADPRAWKHPFNMACALAKGGAGDEAEAPLRRAIELGGSQLRAKARADGDLASVREEPWFQALVAG